MNQTHLSSQFFSHFMLELGKVWVEPHKHFNVSQNDLLCNFLQHISATANYFYRHVDEMILF